MQRPVFADDRSFVGKIIGEHEQTVDFRNPFGSKRGRTTMPST